MEPLRARRAFPCFDEPAMKAQFKMTIVHHKDVNAMSNMPIVTSTASYVEFVKINFCFII